MNETDLRIEILNQVQDDNPNKGNVLTPLSARECTQTLSPIPQGILRRTINGVLVCVSNGGHRKFQSTISCRDQTSPAFEGMWKGTVVRVHCLQFITASAPSLHFQLEREGEDIHIYDNLMKTWPVIQEPDRWIRLSEGFPGGFVTYRPILTMMVKSYAQETNEWGGSVGWTLELEEV
jgi:hypothetical protein